MQTKILKLFKYVYEKFQNTVNVKIQKEQSTKNSEKQIMFNHFIFIYNKIILLTLIISD